MIEEVGDSSVVTKPHIAITPVMTYGIIDLDAPQQPSKKSINPLPKEKRQGPVKVIACDLETDKPKDPKEVPKTDNNNPVKPLPVNSLQLQTKEKSQKNISHKPSIENIKSISVTPSISNLAIQKPEPKIRDKLIPSKSSNILQEKKPQKEPLHADKKQRSQISLTKVSLETVPDSSSLTSPTQLKQFIPKTTKPTSSSSFFTSKPVKTLQNDSQILTQTTLSEQVLNSQINTKIQPSKHSDFQFQMTYFKPIEDSKLDKFIKNVNDSQSLKKKPEGTLSLATQNRPINVEKNSETFSVPLPSSEALESHRIELSTQRSRLTDENIGESIQAYHKKNNSSIKKNPLYQAKNPNNLALKSSMQDLKGPSQKMRDSRTKVGERASLDQLSQNVNETESPKMKNKNEFNSNQKVAEIKARNTFSKLDRLLQEMKENPSQFMNDENIDPQDIECEDGLFGQGSKMQNSSSSTNCSLNRSFANTLRKLSTNRDA